MFKIEGRQRGARLVGTYTTVSTVCASSLLRGLVDLDVLDDEVAGVEPLSIGIGLGVLQETQQEFGRLDGPTRAGNTELLSCQGNPVSTLSLLFPIRVANVQKQLCTLSDKSASLPQCGQLLRETHFPTACT